MQMPKAESTFRPIGDSNNRMPGNTAVLVSGCSGDEQVLLRSVMDDNGLADVPAVYIAEVSLDSTLTELTALPGETNAGAVAKLPRGVVMSGLTENQLHLLMKIYRESPLPQPCWASVTPTNGTWTIKQMLIELLKEREALRQARAAEAEKNSG
jgi:hypothetical protein